MNFRKTMLLATGLACFYSSSVAADTVCTNPDYSATLGSLPIGFKDGHLKWHQNDARPAYESGNRADWIVLMQEHEMADTPGRNQYGNCDYKSAITAFQNFNSVHPSQAEVKLWLSNQDKVFSVCEGGDKVAIDYPETISERLSQEAEYQKLALAYYSRGQDKRVDDKTLEGFKAIGFAKGHPRQIDALRSYTRMVFARQGLEPAWDITETIRSDEATKDIWPDIEDMRFEIITHGRESNEVKDSVAVQEKILGWLLDVMQEKNIPENSGKEFKSARRADAIYNIERYLPEALYSGRGVPPVLDWWLGGQSVTSEMLTSAAKLMKKDDLLALLQMEATRKFVNLSRIYDQDNPVRVQQKNLSEYAFDKYKNCKGPEWLPFALSFAIKDQASLNEIIAAGYKVLDDDFLVKTAPDLRVKIWSELVFAELLAGHNEQAIALIGKDGINSTGYLNPKGDVVNQSLEWFINQGEYDWARKILATHDAGESSSHMRNRYDVYRVILAEDAQHLRTVTGELSSNAVSDEILRPFFNLLPAKEMLQLAQGANFIGYNGSGVSKESLAVRQTLAKTAFVRQWLLKKKDKAAEAALTLEKIDTTGDKSILTALDGDDLEQTVFFLSHPRLRPNGVGFSFEKDWSTKEIDEYDHNDNNWWCSFKPQAEKDDLEKQWALMPNDDYIKMDPSVFAASRRKAIAAHPLMLLIDEAEIQALAHIPDAPSLLSQRAISGAGGKFAAIKSVFVHDDRIPQALHLSIRAARYGCNRDGKHGAYTRKAFEILHRFYKNSAWTKATPYWFN